VIAVDLSKPWLVLECLAKWIKEVKVSISLIFLSKKYKNISIKVKIYLKFRNTKTSGWN